MLSGKRELFVRKIVEGLSQAEAYRVAYSTGKMSDKTVWEKASRLMADDKVRARVKELQDQLSDESIMTAKERLEWLTEVIRNDRVDLKTKLKASDQMNRMQGAYVTRVEGNVGITRLEDLL